MNPKVIAVVIVSSAAVLACSADPVDPRGVNLRVSPLELPGIGQACYDIRVQNAAGGPAGGGETVWDQGTPGHQADTDGDDEVLEGDPDAVCSVQYGNGAGGDITYIGPCDADGQLDADADGERMNSVTLWFDGLYDENGIYIDPDGEDGWQDPCPNGCTLDVLCEENADAEVVFNFTVMRDAQQGFFDVMVNFDDIFCSAKFDTCYDDDPQTAADESGRIRLLHRDGEGANGPYGRWDTGVLAFACTGGPGADTNLYMDDVVLQCGSGSGAYTIKLDPSQDEQGNVDAPEGQDIVFGYATYFGQEELDCPVGEEESAPCKKKFWNIAIGFATNDDHELDDNCTLLASATASDGEFNEEDGEDPWQTPNATKYPIIRVRVPLTPDANSDLTLACDNWGLDELEGPQGVRTRYTSLACDGVDDEASEFYQPDHDDAQDCDFCHRMNTSPDHPIQSDREECGGEGGGQEPEGLVMFVTSQSVTGAFGGLVGADELCSQAGLDAGLGGDFKAWLSLEYGGPAQRFPESWAPTGLPIVLVDGTLVATDWADLLDGAIENPINLSEDGEDFWSDGDGWVWTNTLADGNVRNDGSGSIHACDDFRSDGIEQFPYHGSVLYTDYRWSNEGAVVPIDPACGQAHPLFCLQQPRALRVFATSDDFNGAFGGLEDADGICDDAASNGELGGMYRAWLSLGDASPSNRFTPETRGDRPFELPNGRVVAHDWADLTDGALIAPIRVDEYGSMRENLVWTNTNLDGTSFETDPSQTCDGWTSNAASPGNTKYAGDPWSSSDQWTAYPQSPIGCNFSFGFYCFEQDPGVLPL